MASQLRDGDVPVWATRIEFWREGNFAHMRVWSNDECFHFAASRRNFLEWCGDAVRLAAGFLANVAQIIHFPGSRKTVDLVDLGID